jgi:hypothetical protein
VPKSDERRQPPYSASDMPGGMRLPREVRHLRDLLRQRWELTPLGRRALAEAGERTAGREQVPPYPANLVRCCWCEREIGACDRAIPAADDRLMHDTPECRGEFERFIYGDANTEGS